MIYAQAPDKPILDNPIAIVTQKKEEPKPVEDQLYVIKDGDTLTSIAELQTSSVARLWDKNVQLTNPDQIAVGDTLTVPTVDEQLPDRPLPVKLETIPATQSPPSSGGSLRPVVAGNLYEPYQCTWGVKNWKPEVSNSWGNANNWGYAAQADGWTVSGTPVVNAVAWSTRGSYGHVALVLSIHGDTITIREQNYDWHGSIRTIDVPISDYRYIY